LQQLDTDPSSERISSALSVAAVAGSNETSPLVRGGRADQTFVTTMASARAEDHLFGYFSFSTLMRCKNELIKEV
jgi:hypothetical protein